MQTGQRPEIRRLTISLGLACFSGALSSRATDPFVAALATEFSAPPGEAALLATAFALPFALIQPILGPVGDALGKRWVIRTALWLLAGFALAAPFAPSLGILLVLRALTGAAAGGIMPLSLAAIGDAVPLRDRQVALSRLLVFAISGQIAGGALAGLLAPWIGWRGVLGLCGLVALATALFVALAPAAGAVEPRSRFDPARALGRYRALLGMPAARLLFFAVMVEGVLVFGTFPWFAPILQERGLGGTVEAGLAVAAFGCGGIVYAGIARPVLARLGQSRMVVLGGGLAALALLGFAFAAMEAVFIGAGLLLGIGFYMVHNSIQTRVTELAPEARGSAVALHACHFYIGQSLGPVLVGLAGGALGMAAALALAAAGMLALALRLGRR